MKQIRAKKQLGQHFLKHPAIAEKIVDAFGRKNQFKKAIEVGAGMGILTDCLVKREEFETYVIDIDRESIAYLKQKDFLDEEQLIEGDFLAMDLSDKFSEEPIGVIGNFPYNISTQILFKIYDHRDQVLEMVGMFQKEVADRLVSPPGSRVYGITSVLLQAFYNVEYLFTVDENAFDPPPKVKSSVVRMERNQKAKLECDENLFKRLVKTAFNQRRKTLRNSLKSLWKPLDLNTDADVFKQRPEQLSAEEFIRLTQYFQKIEG